MVATSRRLEFCPMFTKLSKLVGGGPTRRVVFPLSSTLRGLARPISFWWQGMLQLA